MKNNLFTAFESKHFLYLWIGEIFTQIPVNLLNFLLILFVFNLTKSNTAVSIIVLSFTLPAVFLGILAGIYIDKWNKKTVLLIANILRGILLIILGLFHDILFVVYAVSFITSIITQFFIPAESPIIPLIVTEEQLLSANALFGIGIFASILIAYLFSGPLLLYLGIVKTLFLLAGMLLTGAFFISLVKVPAKEEKKGFSIRSLRIPRSAIKKELIEVFTSVKKSEHVLSSVFLLALSQILILILAAIAPGYADQVLHINIEQFPLYFVTPATIGIIASAAIVANKLNKVQKHALITIGIFLSAVIMTILPFGNKFASRSFIQVINGYLPEILKFSNLHIVVILAFLLGVANGLIFIPANTFIQEKTDDRVRGKIYGVMNTLVGIFSFTPILLVGGFSDLVGVSWVVVGIGISLFIIGLTRLFL